MGNIVTKRNSAFAAKLALSLVNNPPFRSREHGAEAKLFRSWKAEIMASYSHRNEILVIPNELIAFAVARASWGSRGKNRNVGCRPEKAVARP